MPSIKRKCPEGQIRRKSYVRKSGKRVKSSCIRDMGRRGKGKSIIKMKNEGSLSKFGYDKVVTKSPLSRHRSLRKAIKKYGTTSVIRKLNAVAVLTRNSNRKLSSKFNADKKWVMRIARSRK